MSRAEELAAELATKQTERNGMYQRRLDTRKFETPLKQLRESLGLSIHAVAREVDLSSSSLDHIEKGSDVRLTSAMRIAEFYGKSIEELWARKS